MAFPAAGPIRRAFSAPDQPAVHLGSARCARRGADPSLSWSDLLRVCVAFELYCRRHGMAAERDAVLEFLIRRPRGATFPLFRPCNGSSRCSSASTRLGSRHPLVPPRRVVLRLAATVEAATGSVTDEERSAADGSGITDRLFEHLAGDGRRPPRSADHRVRRLPRLGRAAVVIARYTIEHSVDFAYDAPVHSSVMTLYLRPNPGPVPGGGWTSASGPIRRVRCSISSVRSETSGTSSIAPAHTSGLRYGAVRPSKWVPCHNFRRVWGPMRGRSSAGRFEARSCG